MNDQDQTRETGQSIILVAVAFLALILFVAIAVDISRAYFDRRTAQNAADAAALAGGQDLADQRDAPKFPKNSNPELVRKAINDYAQRNDIKDTNDDPTDAVNDNVEAYYLVRSWYDPDAEIPGFEILDDPTLNPPFKKNEAIPGDAVGVLAITHIEAPTYFGGVFGLNGLPLTAEAAVSVDIPPCGVTCVVPVATYWNDDPDTGELREFVSSQELEEDEWTVWTLSDTLPFHCYNIWNGEESDQGGNFGWLNWLLQGVTWRTQDCDEQSLASNLEPGNCIGWLSVGEHVAGATGVKTGNPVLTELNKWIDDHQPFTVPLWNEANSEGTGCGDSYYIVAGFARMQLIGYDLSQGGGAAYDPWIPEYYECEEIMQMCENVGYIPAGEDPNCGNRLTAYFINMVDLTSIPGECDSFGTVTTLRMLK
jgi:hypothetical protein